jgi:hypothetical protein
MIAMERTLEHKKGLAKFMSEQEHLDALVAFQRRSVALGSKISPGRNWRIELCASLAGSFVVAINKGERLKPEQLLTDGEYALVWIGVLATEAATQKIGEDFEKALRVTPTWLFEASAIERASDAVAEVRDIHKRIISGPAAGLVAGIANAFLDWALVNDGRGVELLEQHMQDTAALIGQQRRALAQFSSGMPVITE